MENVDGAFLRRNTDTQIMNKMPLGMTAGNI